MTKSKEPKPPRGEILWVSHYDKARNLRYITTSKLLRDQYFLYEVQADGALKKLGKSKNPAELEEKFQVYKHILKEA